jgi:hypothetical protein
LRGPKTYALSGSTSGAGITNINHGLGHLTSTTNTMGGGSQTNCLVELDVHLWLHCKQLVVLRLTVHAGRESIQALG